MNLIRIAPALALAGVLGACAGAGTIARQPADPAVTQKIADACRFYAGAKVAAGIAGGLVPGAGSAVAVIEGFVDPVCADPVHFAGDISTVKWVVKNAAGLKSLAAGKSA